MSVFDRTHGLSALACLATALVLPCASATRAEGAVIVLNNGNVFTGRIQKEDSTTVSILMTWPYKHLQHRGQQKFWHGKAPQNIRWYKLNTEKEDFDLPDDEYWEKYEDIEKYPIDKKYEHLRQRWLLKRKRQDGTETGIVVIDDPLTKGPRLSPLPVEAEGMGFSIRKPEQWTSVVEDNIWVFQAKTGREGFRPRIHVFVGPKLEKATAADQVEWFEARMKRAADEGGFEAKHEGGLKTKANGFDMILTTRTVTRGRSIKALRKIFFRKKRVYFYAAYCHETEFPELRALFERCMSSMRLKEDEKKAKKKPAKAKTTAKKSG